MDEISDGRLAPILLSVAEAVRVSGLGRTKLLEEVASGRLGSVSCGRRRLIPRTALERWAAELADGGLPEDGGHAA